MFKCDKCGCELEELKTIRIHDYDSFYHTEHITTCNCGGDYEEAYDCNGCGELTCQSELEEHSGFYKVCAEALQAKIKAFRDELNTDEWYYIADYLEMVNCEI